MEPLTQTSVQGLWLKLFLVFILCASVASPVYLAEVQTQQVELESEFIPDASEDDELIAGFISELFAQEFLSLSLSDREAQSVVGSDAYPCIALHGPPVPNDTV